MTFLGVVTYCSYLLVWLDFDEIVRSSLTVDFGFRVEPRIELCVLFCMICFSSLGSIRAALEVSLVQISLNMGCQKRQGREEQKLGKEHYGGKPNDVNQKRGGL